MSNNFPAYAADGFGMIVSDVSTRLQIVISAVDRQKTDLLLDNRGTEDLFVRAGDAAVAATTVSIRLPAGAMMTLGRGGATHVAAVARPGKTSSLVVHLGEGA